MGPKEIYDLLASVGALSLQCVELNGLFIQKEVIKGLLESIILRDIEYTLYDLSGYYAGVFADRDGRAVAVYATWLYENPDWGLYRSHTYVASLAPIKVVVAEKNGSFVTIGDFPAGLTYWYEERTRRLVDLPVLPPGLARRILYTMQKAMPHGALLMNHKSLVLPQITLERGSLGIQRVGPVRINPAVLGDKGSVEKLYSYVYALAQRGYEVRVRYVSPLDLVPRVPLLSRVLRLILLWTGLWKKTLWVEVSVAPSW
jgi:hypothetical protein